MCLWINVFNLINLLRHFTVDQIYVYASRKSLKEGVLPTLNLPHPSANANATNNRPKGAIEKREEYALKSYTK